MATVVVKKPAPKPGAMGKTLGDLAGPDLGAVGNAARVSKRSTEAPKELASFNVKKGDNGGIIVSEMRESKTPEGRRPASFLFGGGDVKENPFSAKDGAAAVSHITGLLGEMGIAPEAEAPGPEESPDLAGSEPGGMPPLGPPPPGPPPMAARVTGPGGGSAAAIRGGGPPRGNLAY